MRVEVASCVCERARSQVRALISAMSHHVSRQTARSETSVSSCVGVESTLAVERYSYAALRVEGENARRRASRVSRERAGELAREY